MSSIPESINNIEQLNEIIEKYLISKHSTYRKILDLETGEKLIYKTINEFSIKRLLQKGKIIESDLDYIVEYLKDKNIKVIGNSGILDEKYPDIINYRTYKNIVLPKILTEKEQIELFIEYNYSKDSNGNKDIKLRNKLIEANMKLAMYIVFHYNDIYVPIEYKIDKEDLISYVYEGLISTVENFNPDLENKFSSYAARCLKGKIKTYIRKENSSKNTSQRVYYNLQKCKIAIENETGKQLAYNPEIIIDIEKKYRKEYNVPLQKSLEDCKSFLLSSAIEYQDDEFYSNLIYKEPESEDPTFEQATVNQRQAAIKEGINECMKKLNPREKRLISLRYGFEDGICHTLNDISEEFGVSIERVRQLESKALIKSKKICKKRDLDYLIFN